MSNPNDRSEPNDRRDQSVTEGSRADLAAALADFYREMLRARAVESRVRVGAGFGGVTSHFEWRLDRAVMHAWAAIGRTHDMGIDAGPITDEPADTKLAAELQRLEAEITAADDSARRDELIMLRAHRAAGAAATRARTTLDHLINEQGYEPEALPSAWAELDETVDIIAGTIRVNTAELQRTDFRDLIRHDWQDATARNHEPLAAGTNRTEHEAPVDRIDEESAQSDYRHAGSDDSNTDAELMAGIVAAVEAGEMTIYNPQGDRPVGHSTDEDATCSHGVAEPDDLDAQISNRIRNWRAAEAAWGESPSTGTSVADHTEVRDLARRMLLHEGHPGHPLWGCAEHQSVWARTLQIEGVDPGEYERDWAEMASDSADKIESHDTADQVVDDSGRADLVDAPSITQEPAAAMRPEPTSLAESSIEEDESTADSDARPATNSATSERAEPIDHDTRHASRTPSAGLDGQQQIRTTELTDVADQPHEINQAVSRETAVQRARRAISEVQHQQQIQDQHGIRDEDDLVRWHTDDIHQQQDHTVADQAIHSPSLYR